MDSQRTLNRIAMFGAASLALLAMGCDSYFFLPGTADQGTPSASIFGVNPFVQQLIDERTFFDGKSVTTLTYRVDDASRTPFGIDFNGDGRIDPVAAYSMRPVGIIQILLSQGGAGAAQFLSLTLDGNNAWLEILDLAVGDIDNDGAPDIIAASADGVIYLRNPGPGRTTVLREWGAEAPDLEFLAGSTTFLTNDDIAAIIAAVLPPGATVADFDVDIEQGYTNVEIADINNDRQNDVVAAQRLRLSLEPKDDTVAEPVTLVTGGLQLFINPGNAEDGQGWQLVEIGQHERFNELDRQGASSVLVSDLDGDGDMDLISAAREDDNAQIAWFENPGPVDVASSSAWTQWRIGSIRDAFAIDVSDVTGDGQPDVVATGVAQKQLVLFEQPETGAKREFDWDSHKIVTFEGIEPRDVRAVDIDNDGVIELIVGGTEGALRYFEPGADPREPWTPFRILDFDAGGDVSLLGFGDLDGDGDFDVVAAVDSAEDNEDRISWVRNNLR